MEKDRDIDKILRGPLILEHTLDSKASTSTVYAHL